MNRKQKHKLILAMVEVILAELLINFDKLLPSYFHITGIVIKLLLIAAMLYIFYYITKKEGKK